MRKQFNYSDGYTRSASAVDVIGQEQEIEINTTTSYDLQLHRNKLSLWCFDDTF